MDIGASIDRGVALLNAHTPHWFKLIDLATFDITVCGDCIVGQVFGNGNFADNCNTLGIEDSWDSSHFGFDVEDHEQEELEEAWVDRIAELIDTADVATYSPQPGGLRATIERLSATGQ